jgi:hypothetical protein
VLLCAYAVKQKTKQVINQSSKVNRHTHPEVGDLNLFESQASIKPFSRQFNKVVLYSRKSILTTEILYPSVASGISVVTKRGKKQKKPTLRRNEGLKPT